MDVSAPPGDELAAHYLAALATPGVGPARLRAVVEAYGGLAGVLGGEPTVPGRKDAQLTRLAHAVAASLPGSLPRARREVDEARAAGLRVVCWEDAGYPPALLEDEHAAPPVLFVAGDLPHQVMLPFAQLASCALVGTRRASQPALALARDLARAAARHGLVVVSGLALGVDSAAHEGALEAPAGSGTTVAVLGGGHGRLHPAGNRGLADRVLRHGGAVLSEWPPGVNPQPHHFLRRNRLIACLARVVGVVEAGTRSGALNTASHAAELGRTVLAVPGRPQDVRNRGALELLREGAAPLIDAADLLHHFGLSVIETPKAEPRERGGRSAVVPAPAAHVAGLQAGSSHRERFAAVGLENAFRGAEATVDQLSRATGLPASELLASLALLELDGRVAATGGGRYRWRG